MINLHDTKSVKERRQALEKEMKISLANIGHFSIDENITSTRNCENMIGVSQIPMGVAGPLRLTSLAQGKLFLANYFLPLATTEGALVASVNRGCKAVSGSGGVNVYVEKVGITRGPVFETKSLAESFKLADWFLSHLSYLGDLSRKTSKHLTLLKIEPQVLGKKVYVRFYFNTDQAMGMNMATIAVNFMVPYIEKETQSRCLSISGNFCVDKKPSWSNFLLGRGRKVWAEAFIPEKIVKEVLKTSPEKIYEVWLNKCMLGSAISGTMGANSHFANIVAAIFAATGQDLAHVAEASLGMTTVELTRVSLPMCERIPHRKWDKWYKDLYISVYLPDLPIGVIGGGINLATQKEALSIIFGKRVPDADEFACVLGGAVLAGELSLLASLAEDSLACSHQRLARGQ